MELLLKGVIAPLLIAGIVAVFRLRGMVWLVGPILVRKRKVEKRRLLQSFIVWNGGGQSEENISIRIPQKLRARLIASNDGLATQDGDVINIAALPSGDRCEMLLALDEEITGATQVSVRSKAVKKAAYAKAEKDVVTASGLGWFLSFLLIVVSIAAFIAIDSFFSSESGERGATSEEKGSETKSAWPNWESVGDFPKGDLAKYYPSPSFPVVAGAVSRKGDVVMIPFTINNVSERSVTFRVSLSSSESSEDPRPWERKDLVNDLVVGPASQKSIILSTFFPKKVAEGYVVAEVTMSYADNTHFARRVFEVK